VDLAVFFQRHRTFRIDHMGLGDHAVRVPRGHLPMTAGPCLFARQRIEGGDLNQADQTLRRWSGHASLQTHSKTLHETLSWRYGVKTYL
jgi:hypothetical protein